jgi:hypothetical protein
MKIRFTGELEFTESPDDKGSVDVWLCNSLGAVNHLETDEAFDKLKLKWVEVRPRGRPKKVKDNDQNSEV